MTASSPIPPTETPNRGRQAHDCPSWCVYTPEEHAAAEVRDLPDDRPLHKSDKLGPFQFWAIGDEAPLADVTNAEDLTAADLRALAVEAIEAARWLDDHGPTAPGAGKRFTGSRENLPGSPKVSGPCPSWCVGHHDPVSDFHRSEARTWHSEIPVIGVRELLAVRIDQFITEEGETEAPEIVIDGKVGEVGDLYNFSIGDAERLASALSVMLERIAAEHYSTAAREWLAITQETISRM